MSTEEWPKEVVPDVDTLFMRVHKSFLPNGELQPGVFRDHEGGMSTNWEKYCPTPEDCRQKANKNPQNNGVLRFAAGPMRAVPMVVDHTPFFPEDRSHVDVVGEKKSAEIRLKMLDICTLILHPTT